MTQFMTLARTIMRPSMEIYMRRRHMFSTRRLRAMHVQNRHGVQHQAKTSLAASAVNCSSCHQPASSELVWSITCNGYGDSGGSRRCSCAGRVMWWFNVTRNSSPCGQNLSHGFAVQAIVGLPAGTTAACLIPERSKATTAVDRSTSPWHG